MPRLSEQELDQLSADRLRRHGHKAGRRDFAVVTTDRIGLAGEDEFSRVFFDLPVDRLSKDGDGGTDFLTPVGSVDVKTYTRPFLGLLVEAHKVRADIFVLAGYDPARKVAWLEGWAWREELLGGTKKDFGGHGIVSYHLPVSALRSISVLRESIKKRLP